MVKLQKCGSYPYTDDTCHTVATTTELKNVIVSQVDTYSGSVWNKYGGGDGELFNIDLLNPDDKYRFKVEDEDVGANDQLGASYPWDMNFLLKLSSGTSLWMGSESINEQVGTKKKTASVKYSVCMDTVGWTINGWTCDSLDGTSCDLKTEKAKPGVDLSVIGNDPASNCCACGKRGKGDQKAPTPASPNGSYCTKPSCLPSAFEPAAEAPSTE